jgi:hypothetical protein
MRFPGFIGPSYTLQSVNVDCQRCVNLFPEMNELGTGKEREVASLVPTPGLRLLLTLPDSPVRGQWRASDGTLFAVGGSKLYSISSVWAATELGQLSTSEGPVSMSDNGTHLVVVDGHSGYYWNISDSTFGELEFPEDWKADQVAFQDGYFIFNRQGTAQFFISGLNDITFDATEISTAEGKPDGLLALVSSSQNIVLFGAQSTEVFYNSGDADFPFARMQGAVIDVGIAAPFSVGKLQAQVYWLGGDENGSGTVYRSQGYQAQRISTPAIESEIRKLTSEQIAAATAWTYQQGGHHFYCLNIPGMDSTWVFDASTNFWHERVFLDSWALKRHRAETHAVAYGQNIVGDYETGRIYALDLETYTDNGTSIVRLRSAPHFSKGLKKITHHSFQLDMETGVGLDGTTQGTNPKAIMRWSDDGGKSWSNERWADIGKIGETKKRVLWRRLGASRDRVYEVSVTDPVKVVLIGAELEVEEGVA